MKKRWIRVQNYLSETWHSPQPAGYWTKAASIIIIPAIIVGLIFLLFVFRESIFNIFKIIGSGLGLGLGLLLEILAGGTVVCLILNAIWFLIIGVVYACCWVRFGNNVKKRYRKLYSHFYNSNSGWIARAATLFQMFEVICTFVGWWIWFLLFVESKTDGLPDAHLVAFERSQLTNEKHLEMGLAA